MLAQPHSNLCHASYRFNCVIRITSGKNTPEMLVALLLMHELPCGSPNALTWLNKLSAKGVDC